MPNNEELIGGQLNDWLEEAIPLVPPREIGRQVVINPRIPPLGFRVAPQENDLNLHNLERFLGQDIKPRAKKTIQKKTKQEPILAVLLNYQKIYPKEQLFGYELEVEEGPIPLPKAPEGFTVKADGSLRNGKEYVFNQPHSLENATRILENFFKELKETNPIFSFRTSTHIHLNIQHLPLNEVNNLLYLIHLFDSVLVNFCAPYRQGNRFCLRTKDATEKVFDLEQWITRLNTPPEDHSKYSAVNICPMTTQGSIEFRSLEGTMDLQKITTWLSIIKILFDKASTFKNIKEINTVHEKLGHRKFFELLFEEFAEVLNYPNLESDLGYTKSLLISIPHHEPRSFT